MRRFCVPPTLAIVYIQYRFENVIVRVRHLVHVIKLLRPGPNVRAVKVPLQSQVYAIQKISQSVAPHTRFHLLHCFDKRPVIRRNDRCATQLRLDINATKGF